MKEIKLSKRVGLALLALLLLVPAVPAKASPAPSAGLGPLEKALVSKMTDEVYSAYLDPARPHENPDHYCRGNGGQYCCL